MDIESMKPGQSIGQRIEEVVSSCDVLVALIGQRWAATRDRSGRRRLSDEDYVRLEIATALEHGVDVIPVLVEGAPMPAPRSLPDDLRRLSDLNAPELSDVRWSEDLRRLVSEISGVLTERRQRRRREDAERRRAQASLRRRDRWLVLINAGFLLALLAPMAWKGISRWVNIKKVLVPQGSFQMGAADGDENERPVHTVKFDASFYMGSHEVTQAEWLALMDYNPSTVKGDLLPVENVSLAEAEQFISLLNQMNDDFIYYLPSEAEWEYACRKWAPDDADPRAAARQSLYGMHDGVWEWCADWYHRDYGAGAPEDGHPWRRDGGGDESMRILRGGASGGRCSSRYWIKQADARGAGLRVAAQLKGQFRR